VPAVFGWIALDRRGTWLLRNERIAHPGIRAFINRNYGRDGAGRWFFQNGPQRVYVSLEYTPFIYRARETPGDMVAIETQGGNHVDAVCGAWLDDEGNLLLETGYGIGVVHDQDLECLLPSFCDAQGTIMDGDGLTAAIGRCAAGRDVALWLKLGGNVSGVGSISRGAVPAHFGFVREPAPAPGEAACV
jgi:hypothetical protein